MEPRYKRGDFLRIPHVTPGHNNHDPKKRYMVKRVFPGKSPREITYILHGLTANWPETRVTHN